MGREHLLEELRKIYKSPEKASGYTGRDASQAEIAERLAQRKGERRFGRSVSARELEEVLRRTRS